MIRISIFIILFIGFIEVHAGNRDVSDIRAIALSHWTKNDAMNHAKEIAAADVSLSYNHIDNLYYVVTRKATAGQTIPGFILVSADTSMPEILGFSDEGTFTYEDMPEHVRMWMERYKEMQSQSDDETNELEAWLQSSRTGNDDVNALLGGIEWGQDNPYNAFCPEKDGKKTPSGCVATALSQIMMYHKYPEHGRGSIDYYTRTNNFHVACDFEHTYFDWDNMYEKYDRNVSDEYMVNPIATLLTTVGVAVQMDYNTGGSGSNNRDTYYGVRNYLCFDNDAFLAGASNYSSELWHKTLQNELLENRPVYYTGHSGDSGHAFVIDGMQKAEDGTMYYHVNWGWDGLCNGYYLLNMLRPKNAGTGGVSGANYSNGNSMICGLMPEDGINHVKMSCSVDVVSKQYLPEQLVQLCVGASAQSNDVEADIDFYLVSKENDYLSYHLGKVPNQIFSSTQKWTDYYVSYYLPHDIPVGKYELCIQCTGSNQAQIETIGSFPEIEILPSYEWFGGVNASPKEYVGIYGTINPLSVKGRGQVSLTPEYIQNLSEKSIYGDMAFLVTDTEGKLLSVMDDKTPISLSASSSLRNYGLAGTFSREMPDGNYWLCLGFKSSADDKWTYAYEMSFDKSIWMSTLTLYSLPFNVNNGIITIENHSFEGADIPWVETGMSLTMNAITGQHIYDINGRKAQHPLKDNIYIIDNKKRIMK